MAKSPTHEGNGAEHKDEPELTEVQKLEKEELEKAKSYKAKADVERAYKLAVAAKILVEYPALNHLGASFSKELKAMEMKQEEEDTKEQEEYQKKLVEAQAKDAAKAAEKKKKEAEEAAKQPPPPHSQPRDTRSGV